ncbi:triose-phosphate isomerase [Sphingomonas mucosissima]|uniref:Triosephosphate isomerase n=1 Tax=Sphingomonas mucosissima TaxID=370959 RepID=A0A245ZR12_9SPHN|nr:triose-phosphate isomerase [Sphingomonas mucosissima]OWK32177.1 triosephosphate isomerase [Sphingomonas mucosissima]
MRRKFVAGNWKMNGNLAALTELQAIAAAADPRVDVAVAVPATLIHPAAQRAGFPIGAEDVHAADSGAHTGCVSASMIKEAGAAFSIVGHSERRQGQKETDADVKAKAEACHRHGLDAILCVGETLEQREAGQAEQVVTAQVRASLPEGASGDWLAIAYEPIWAIGTGEVATVADVEAMHAAIRGALVAALGAEQGGAIRLLYGGSVTADNAAGLLHAAEVDGALVGGASLTAAKFAPIIAAAIG